jgi:hypothetical protein
MESALMAFARSRRAGCPAGLVCCDILPFLGGGPDGPVVNHGGKSGLDQSRIFSLFRRSAARYNAPLEKLRKKKL